MSEHSVQVVISGQGGQRIRLRWQGAASARSMVLQVASAGVAPLAPSGGVDAGAEVALLGPPRGSALSLELRLHEPAPVVVAPPAPRADAAPLATAWATEHLRGQPAATRPPRAPSEPPRSRVRPAKRSPG